MKFSIVLLLILTFALRVASFEGVRGVWVSSDQWVNTKTPKDFAESAIRIDGNRDSCDEKKALSVYSWLQRCMGYGGTCDMGPKGSEYICWDGWADYHVYPKIWCTLWANLFGEIWMDYRNSSSAAQFVHVNNGGHAETALQYTDRDAVTRWHHFDAHLGYYAYTRNGSRIASTQDIIADFTLLSNPSRRVWPYFKNASCTTMACVKASSDWSYVTDDGLNFSFLETKAQWRDTYKTRFAMRKGESLRRQWHNDNKACWPLSQDSYGAGVYGENWNPQYTPGGKKDPKNYWIYMAYVNVNTNKRDLGNGYHVYTPDLTGGRYANNVKSSSGLASGSPAAGQPALRASAAGSEGNAIWEIRNIYPYCESFVTGEYLMKTAGRICFDLSIDSGTSWSPACTLQAVSASPQPFSVDLGKGRWDRGLSTTFNMACRPEGDPGSVPAYYGYRYLVRARILANAAATDVGLSSLTFRNTLMFNLFSLPTLMVGNNSVTVEGDSLSAGCAMKVVYAWQTGAPSNPKRDTSVHYAFSLPHTYAVAVTPNTRYNDYRDTLYTRCRSIEISVVDTSVARTAVEQSQARLAPSGMSLTLYPNPLRSTGSAVIRCSAPAGAEISILDLRGRTVKTLVNGYGSVNWDGRDNSGAPVTSGVYIVRVKAGMVAVTRTLAICR